MIIDPRLNDSVPPSDITWHPVALGVGQVPSAFGHFQFTFDGEPRLQTDTRRDPDNLPPTVVSRWNERPY